MYNDDEIVELDDVEAIDETDEKLMCLIGEVEVWIPRDHILIYSEVLEQGDVGVLALPRWVVDELGLVV